MKGNTFIILALLFGGLFVFLIPPFQSPDESNHFLRAFQVSEGHLFPEKTNQRLGAELPTSLSQVCDSFLYLRLPPNARLNASTLFRLLKKPLQAEQRQFTDFANTAIYSPTAYLPQATAIALLRPLGATPLQLLYAARLANLLVWVLLVSAALRILPFMQDAVATLALFPASLVIAASAGADVFTNGLCWWLIATFLAKRPMALDWQQYAAAGIVALNKLITVPVVFLSLLLEKSKWKSVGLILMAGVFALFWAVLSRNWFIPYDEYHPAFRDTQTLNSGVNPTRQMAFVLENPLYFIQVTVTSLFDALPSLAAHLTGKFGWEKNYLPAPFILMLWLALAGLVVSAENPLKKRERLGLFAVVFMYVWAFAFTMYALWCAVGSEQLHNWQGRYFVPVLPLVLLIVGGSWWLKWRQWAGRFALAVLVLSNLAMALAIYQRYLINGE